MMIARRFSGTVMCKLGMRHSITTDHALSCRLVVMQAWGNFRRATSAGVDGNFKGDGFTMGGVFLLGKGDVGVAFKHNEKTFGDHVDADQVSACLHRGLAVHPLT
jgi:hypothetical protein